MASALEAKLEYELTFGLDKWYEELKDCTAPTVFLELEMEESRALFRAFKEEVDLQALEDRLDQAIREVGCGEGAFLKASTRSPKDVFHNERSAYFEQLKHEMLQFMQEHPKGSANDDTVEFCDAVRRRFRVDSGKAALAMLLASTRVRSDLDKLVDQGECGMVLVVRAFRPCRRARRVPRLHLQPQVHRPLAVLLHAVLPRAAGEARQNRVYHSRVLCRARAASPAL